MKRLFVLLTAAAAVVSCLDPKGEAFVDIPHPEPGAITLDLANITEDTIIIDRLTTIQIDVSGYSLINITDIEATLGDHPLAGVAGFEIYPPNFESGFYTLKVHVTGNTGTGSLAYHLGRENFDLTREFPVIVDKEPPPPTEIVRMDTTGGTLTIWWNKCKKRNFTDYSVHKTYENSSGTWATLTNVNDTSWTDHTYVGGPVEYRIIVNTEMGHSWGNPLLYNWDPAIRITIDDQGFPTAHWKKTPFYNNTVKYILTGSGLNYIEASLSDTVYAVLSKVPFGVASSFNVRLVSISDWYSKTIAKEYYIGERYYWPVALPRLYNSKENLYYGFDPMNGGRLVVMDENLNVVFDEYGQRWWTISNNGEYFISVVDDNFYFTDPHTLQITLAFETGGQFVRDFIMADNGLVGFRSGDGYHVVDINSGDEKFELSSSEDTYSTLSPSGEYLITDSKMIFHYNGDSFELVGTLPSSFNGYSSFAFTDADNIINANNGSEMSEIVEYDINSLAEISRTQVGSPPISSLRFDHVSKKAVFQTSSSNYIWDSATKQAQMIIANFTTFLNGMLFNADSYSVFSINHTDLPQ